MNKRKLLAFLFTLAAFAAFAGLVLCCRKYRVGHRLDSCKQAWIRAERSQLQRYSERCDALGGVTVRLHDATDNVLYDELCLVPNP
jgi:hypothetical protein